MEFSELAAKRRSVRSFEDREVEAEKLQEILSAVSSAPSAGNLQAFEVVVVRREEQRKMLAGAALSQQAVAQAPVCLVFFADLERSAKGYGRRGRELYSVQDATIACTFAMLAAENQGLKSVWIGAFDDEGVSRAVKAPKHLRPVAILPIGYGRGTPERTPRRGAKEIAREEEFS